MLIFPTLCGLNHLFMTDLITTVCGFKFNHALEQVAQLHHNVSSLMLKKAWSATDQSLFLQDAQHFTADGYRAYWEAVDKTVRFCDSILLKKNEQKKFKQLKKQKSVSTTLDSSAEQTDQNDWFKWRNPKFKSNFGRLPSFRRLPTPPRIRRAEF